MPARGASLIQTLLGSTTLARRSPTEAELTCKSYNSPTSLPAVAEKHEARPGLTAEEETAHLAIVPRPLAVLTSVRRGPRSAEVALGRGSCRGLGSESPRGRDSRGLPGAAGFQGTDFFCP